MRMETHGKRVYSQHILVGAAPRELHIWKILVPFNKRLEYWGFEILLKNICKRSALYLGTKSIKIELDAKDWQCWRLLHLTRDCLRPVNVNVLYVLKKSLATLKY